MRHDPRLTRLERARRKRPATGTAVLTYAEQLQRAIDATAETWPEPPTVVNVVEIRAFAAALVADLRQR